MTFFTLNSPKINILNILHPVLLCIFLCIVFTAPASAQTETLGPPSLGEETKGKPAIDETQIVEDSVQGDEESNSIESESPLGTATITEHKRESGQVYLIEFEHSLGGKQYLYENDSDGQIGSSVESNESIKEIPKWKLGSW